jgi:glycosyltransferase involved in cell wall biosynthesis
MPPVLPSLETPAEPGNHDRAAAQSSPKKTGADVSIVVPAFNEGESLGELVDAVRDNLAAAAVSTFEIVLVDDGSTDATWETISRLHAHDGRVKGVRLRRRCGKGTALAAGFRRATGAVVVMMDADLQDDPADLPEFLHRISEGFDVVVGWKVKRRAPFMRRVLSRIFNLVARMTLGVRIHDVNNGFKAFRRDVLTLLPLYGDLFRFIAAFATAEGYRVGEVPVRHHDRRYGRSRYGAERILRGFFDLLSVVFLTKFSKRPMHLFGLIGLGLLVLGLGTDGYLSVLWSQGHKIGDRPLLLLGVLEIILGIQFFSTGLVAEFLTYQHQRARGWTDLPVREETE